MGSLFRLHALLPLAAILGAQTAAQSGGPIRVDYSCTPEDVIASGLNCTAESPCPVFLELTAVEAVGARLFVAGNLHTESTTLQTILLASPDTGQTWTEPFQRLRGASLDRIQFFDYETGWVAGQVVQPLPRDPFFLLTTDGGATWRRRPVFSETRPGAVDRFRFDSRTQGELWIDRSQSGDEGARFERYETTTGGESWTLRSAVSRAPAPEPARKDSGWRLRADPAARSYRVERRVEGQWQSVAAFLIPAGECRPELSPIPEPPPPPPPEPPKPAKPAPKKK